MKFNFKVDRVDTFFYQLVGVKKEYQDLWKVMKLIFILSHCQSYTERGFSVNKMTTDVNMEAESLIAQRFIYDVKNYLFGYQPNFLIQFRIQKNTFIEDI